MYVGIAKPRWRGKRSRHSRHMRNPQIYVSGKRPMGCLLWPLYKQWQRSMEYSLPYISRRQIASSTGISQLARSHQETFGYITRGTSSPQWLPGQTTCGRYHTLPRPRAPSTFTIISRDHNIQTSSNALPDIRSWAGESNMEPLQWCGKPVQMPRWTQNVWNTFPTEHLFQLQHCDILHGTPQYQMPRTIGWLRISYTQKIYWDIYVLPPYPQGDVTLIWNM